MDIPEFTGNFPVFLFSRPGGIPPGRVSSLFLLLPGSKMLAGPGIRHPLFDPRIHAVSAVGSHVPLPIRAHIVLIKVDAVFALLSIHEIPPKFFFGQKHYNSNLELNQEEKKL